MLEMLVGIAIVVVLGLSIEYLRRGKLQTWVEQQDGEFAADGAVPEAAWYDGAAEGVSYRNIARFTRGGVTYVVAEYHRYRSQGIGGEVHGGTSSQVLCLARLPGRTLPALMVVPPRPDIGIGGGIVDGMRRVSGIPEPPTIDLPDPVPGFVAAFEVRARRTDAVPGDDAVAAALTPAVQQAVADHASVLAGVVLDGEHLRVQMVTQQLKRNHAQALAAAQAIVAALGPK